MKNDSNDQIAVWQLGIEQTFTNSEGVFGERIVPIDASELRHKARVECELRGFDRIMGAFQDFAKMTVDEATLHGENVESFRLLVMLSTLRRFRAAINLFYLGYYFEAASLLRAVFENVVYLGALLNNFVGEWENWGVKPFQVSRSAPDISKKARIDNFRELDKALKKKMWGEESGLTCDEQDLLNTLVDALHSHVHRTESAMFFSLKNWHETGCPIMLSSELNLQHASTVSTAFDVTAWGLLKVLPFLSKPNLYSAEWRRKYLALNGSFREYARLNGKPINNAIQSFIDSKFNFEGTAV